MKKKKKEERNATPSPPFFSVETRATLVLPSSPLSSPHALHKLRQEAGRGSKRATPYKPSLVRNAARARTRDNRNRPGIGHPPYLLNLPAIQHAYKYLDT